MIPQLPHLSIIQHGGLHFVSKELPPATKAIPIKWLKYEKALRALKESGYKFMPPVNVRLHPKFVPLTTRYKQR